jgi:hypothetical protein
MTASDWRLSTAVYGVCYITVGCLVLQALRHPKGVTITRLKQCMWQLGDGMGAAVLTAAQYTAGTLQRTQLPRMCVSWGIQGTACPTTQYCTRASISCAVLYG